MAPEAMKAHIRDFVDAQNSDDWAVRLAPFFTDNVEFEQFRAVHADFRRAFAAYHFEMDQIIAEGDIVAFRGTVTARFVDTFEWGGLRGVPANGETLRWQEVVFGRFEGDRWVEAWFLVDGLSRLQQLGVIPADGG
jgi:predicted ester cyclase